MYKNDKNIFDRLDYISFDPLIFGRIFGNLKSLDVSFDELFFGVIENIKKPQSFLANSNDQGIVYLPAYGYIITNLPNTHLEICYSLETDSIEVKKNNLKIDFEYEKESIYEDSGNCIEISKHPSRGLEPFFQSNITSSQELNIVESYELHSGSIKKALSIIKNEYPFFYQLIVAVIKRIVVFENDDIRSFASVGSFGTSFLSTSSDSSLIFFLEDIIHQSAHNIFYAATFLRRKELFKCDPHTRINTFTFNKEDGRSVYGAFHGLFTQANINIFFDKSFTKDLFNGDYLHEIRGRQSDDMKRWIKSLDIFRKHDILTDEGYYLFHELDNVYKELSDKYNESINSFNTENQPYIFSYKKFKEVNPMPY